MVHLMKIKGHVLYAYHALEDIENTLKILLEV